MISHDCTDCQERVLKNLVLAQTITVEHWHKYRGLGLEWDDLFQESCLGLCIAAWTWNPEQFPRNEFADLAGAWIRCMLKQLVSQQRRYSKTKTSGAVPELLESTGPFGSVPQLPAGLAVPVRPRVVRGRIIWAIDILLGDAKPRKRKNP